METVYAVWLITASDRPEKVDLMGICATEARADRLIADKMESLEMSYKDFIVEPIDILDDDTAMLQDVELPAADGESVSFFDGGGKVTVLRDTASRYFVVNGDRILVTMQRDDDDKWSAIDRDGVADPGRYASWHELYRSWFV